MRRAFHFGIYLTFRFFLSLIRIVPITVVFFVGFGCGEIIYWLMWRRRGLALINLTRAFGGTKSDGELGAIARRHFQTLGANLLCGFKITTMSRDEVLARVTVEKPAALEVPSERERTGWVAMISHLSNWELFGLLTSLFPEYQYGAVYQQLANPFIDGYLRKMREKTGVVLFERQKGFLRGVDFLRDGGVIGVLVDQSAGYAGLWTSFFGRLASCSTLAATLAIRADVPIVPIAIYTRGIARWCVAASAPIESGIDDIEHLTVQINRQLEGQILKSPSDWLWSHNRWKPLRPHFLLARDQRRCFLPADGDYRALDPFRILIQSPPTLFQAQDSLPAVRAIKAGRPDTFLAIWTESSLVPFWEGTSDVDQVIELPNSRRPSVSRIAALRKFDAAIMLSASFWNSLDLYRAGIPIRVGPRHTIASCFYNQYLPEPLSGPNHERITYLRIAQSVGANINADLTQDAAQGTRATAE